MLHRTEVFTAVTVKNVFWNIKIQFVQETHYVSATGPSHLMLHKIEVFTAMTMKDVLSFCHIVFLHSILQFLVTANVDLSSPSLVTLMTEMIHSSKTSVLT
jgi:hypothetical protein